MNIEEIFKSSLENSEMPFEPKAWEAMSSRLDQALPVSTPKTSYTWAWVAGVALVAGISAFFFLNGGTSTAARKQQISKVEAAGENTGNTSAAAGNGKAAEDKASNQQGAAQATGPKQGEASRPAIANAASAPAGTPASTKGNTPNDNNIPVAVPTQGPKDAKSAVFIAPKLNDKYCENEKITFKNQNDFAISLASSNGVNFTAEAGQTISVDLSEAGDYFFLLKNADKRYLAPAFKVQQKPRADFFANNETIYKNGLPVNELEASANAKEYAWMNAKGEVLSRDKTPDIHLFTKGQHDITLRVEDANGCASQVTKPVRCEGTYNLLAVTGFNPESTIEDNRTFIPYALLNEQRNIPFEMEIVDPKTGQTVYRTKDANEPWDGIDMNTRQMVPSGATFIWRVSIYKKEVGEPKNVYQGMITRI